MQMVASASRQLATSASDASSPSHSLPSYLHSLDLPFSAAQSEPVLVVTDSVPDVASDPACTPRMVEILPNEGICVCCKNVPATIGSSSMLQYAGELGRLLLQLHELMYAIECLLQCSAKRRATKNTSERTWSCIIACDT